LIHIEEKFAKFTHALVGAVEFLGHHVAAAHGPGAVASEAANRLAQLAKAHAELHETAPADEVIVLSEAAKENQAIAEAHGIDLTKMPEVPFVEPLKTPAPPEHNTAERIMDDLKLQLQHGATFHAAPPAIHPSPAPAEPGD
jgi:hypothetical protein